MKQLFFLFGLSAVSYSAFCQQVEGHQKTGDKFAVSVFANSNTLHPTKRADIGVSEKLSAQFPKWYISTDCWTGGFKDLNGPGISVSGATLGDKATTVMNNQLRVVGVQSSDWVLSGEATNPDHYQYLYYTQSVSGNKVAFATMTFRFTPDNKLVRITMNAYGNPNLSLVPIISTDKALEVALSDLDGAIVSSKSIEDKWEWFPIPSENGFTLHPAYKFLVEGRVQESNSIPLNMTGYVDAIDGTLLYRDNETKDVTNLKVVDSIYTNGYLNPKTKVGLPYITVKIGATTLLANDTGFVSSTAFSIPTNDSIFLKGSWSIVKSATSANKTPAAYITVSKLDSVYMFPTTTTLGIASSSRHVNAYYHVNTVHDFMKKQYPSFTGLDYPLVTNVDVTGTCNAYYTGAGGSSINFYPAGGGCVSFAEVRDVIYHEYGHGIVDKLYTSLKGSGMANGGLNEGQADVWGLSITGSPILAEGYLGTAGTYIRRYDLAPKMYPQDIYSGDVHTTGEIIAGAWWDYGVNMGSVAEMAKLFSKTLYDVPDGPNGTEEVVFHAVLMSALINDDNDADLSNGTPHFTQIVTAFAKHGIYLLQDVTIAHNEIPHQPKSTPITINASLTVSNPYFFKSLVLVYRNNRLPGVIWDTIVMNNLGSYNFTATIPAQAQGTIVDYYFATKDVLNIQGVFFPYYYYPTSMLAENTVNLYHQFGVGISAQQKIDFETPLSTDWQLGLTGDAATVGKWIQAVPIVAYNGSLMSQTDKDHTSGTGKCLVTGNAPLATSSAYTASVKNGSTTVLSPMYDLSAYTNPIVEFYRWYGNGRGNYPKTVSWRVQLSNGSPVIYRDVDYTTQSDYQWRRRMFKPLEVFSSASQMQLKFIATEAHPTGATNFALVEAAIDDIIIYEGVAGSGITETPKALAKIYPNPAVQILNIELPSSYQEVSISFFDMSGKLVSTVPTTNGVSKYAIETKNMVSGQYMLVIKMDKTIQSSTITIQNP